MASHTEMGGSNTGQFGIWNDMFHKQISFKIMIPLKALGLVKEIQGLSSNFQTQPLLTYQIDPPRICATKKIKN